MGNGIARFVCMPKSFLSKPLHDPSNDVVSGILHLIGVGLAVAVLVVLIVVAVRYGTVWHVVAYALYGTGLILLYLSSSTYHLIPHRFTRAKHLFRRVDHAMIYVLIAATYTPVTFVTLYGGWRWSLFGVIWGLAIVGCVLKMADVTIPSGMSTVFYLAMGWCIVIAFAPLRAQLSTVELWLLFSGGLSYTVGVVCFVFDRVLHRRRYFWMHELFHVFVLGGSSLHTVFMFFILSV